MTMPKKGTRKITVGGTEYSYRIKGYDIITLTVEFPDGKYHRKDFDDLITPKDVEEFIKSEQ